MREEVTAFGWYKEVLVCFFRLVRMLKLSLSNLNTMNAEDIILELEKAGSDQIKKILLKHGAKEPFFGVKVEDMKKIMKKVKEDRQQIAMELFDSGIGDAQYMAGLMADGSQMTKKQIEDWSKKASWSQVSEYSVPWVTSEHPDGFEIGLKWIDSKDAKIAATGWCTINAIVSVRDDKELQIATLRKLLSRVEKEIFSAPNRVRYCMNNFVIAVGCFVKELSKDAMAVGKKIGEVEVDMGGTSCKVPFAPDYIKKVIDKGTLGKKKKTAKC